MNNIVLNESPHAERNRRTGEQRRRKTRIVLVKAAIDVIAQRGYEAPVIDDFILAAGVSRGSFYNHFRTKEVLLDAIAECIRCGSLEKAEIIRTLIDDPAERLVWGVRDMVWNAGHNPRVTMLLLAESPQATAFDALIRKGPKYDIAECIEKRRLPYQDIEVAVDLVAGATREAARSAITVPRPKDHAEQVALLILRGLGMGADEAAELAYKPQLVIPEHLQDAEEGMRAG